MTPTLYKEMVEALRLSERNLTSLIDANHVNALLFRYWRAEIWRVLRKIEE